MEKKQKIDLVLNEKYQDQKIDGRTPNVIEFCIGYFFSIFYAKASSYHPL
jgi:hypothetical protein